MTLRNPHVASVSAGYVNRLMFEIKCMVSDKPPPKMYHLIFKGIPNAYIIHNNFIFASSSASKWLKNCSFKGAATAPGEKLAHC